MIFSTDSFVVSPWEFPGGDIGKLAVCGTVNDLCMAGGEPRYLSLALILEEGFLLSDLKRIVRSIADQAKAAGVSIVTGDTKVVESGKGDGIYINTAGIGFQRAVLPGRQGFQPGDAVLVSGSIGCHGAAVMLAVPACWKQAAHCNRTAGRCTRLRPRHGMPPRPASVYCAIDPPGRRGHHAE